MPTLDWFTRREDEQTAGVAPRRLRYDRTYLCQPICGTAQQLRPAPAALRERVRSAECSSHSPSTVSWCRSTRQIGREILAQQAAHGWGAKVIDRLSEDLRRAFPEMKGFSPRNLKYMRASAEAWPGELLVQEALAQITVVP